MRIIRSPIWPKFVKPGMIVLLLLLIIASAAVALDSPQAILRHVEGSGGQKVILGTAALNGTVGEPVVGPFVAAGEYRLASGYWRGVTSGTIVYLPSINR